MAGGGTGARMWWAVCCWALLMRSAMGDENSEFLDYINQYRTKLSLPTFTSNSGAACVAQQVADQYKDTKCSNSTGIDTVSGQEPQLSEDLLKKCNLQLDNVKDGFTGPACVPTGTSSASAPKDAADSIFESQSYTEAINSSQYVSAGAGSVNSEWFVIVLATNTSNGNYVNQNLDPSGAPFLSMCLTLPTILAYAVSSLLLG